MKDSLDLEIQKAKKSADQDYKKSQSENKIIKKIKLLKKSLEHSQKEIKLRLMLLDQTIAYSSTGPLAPSRTIDLISAYAGLFTVLQDLFKYDSVSKTTHLSSMKKNLASFDEHTGAELKKERNVDNRKARIEYLYAELFYLKNIPTDEKSTAKCKEVIAEIVKDVDALKNWPEGMATSGRDILNYALDIEDLDACAAAAYQAESQAFHASSTLNKIAHYEKGLKRREKEIKERLKDAQSPWPIADHLEYLHVAYVSALHDLEQVCNLTNNEKVPHLAKMRTLAAALFTSIQKEQDTNRIQQHRFVCRYVELFCTKNKYKGPMNDQEIKQVNTLAQQLLDEYSNKPEISDWAPGKRMLGFAQKILEPDQHLEEKMKMKTPSKKKRKKGNEESAGQKKIKSQEHKLADDSKTIINQVKFQFSARQKRSNRLYIQRSFTLYHDIKADTAYFMPAKNLFNLICSVTAYKHKQSLDFKSWTDKRTQVFIITPFEVFINTYIETQKLPGLEACLTPIEENLSPEKIPPDIISIIGGFPSASPSKTSDKKGSSSTPQPSPSHLLSLEDEIELSKLILNENLRPIKFPPGLSLQFCQLNFPIEISVALNKKLSSPCVFYYFINSQDDNAFFPLGGSHRHGMMLQFKDKVAATMRVSAVVNHNGCMQIRGHSQLTFQGSKTLLPPLKEPEISCLLFIVNKYYSSLQEKILDYYSAIRTFIDHQLIIVLKPQLNFTQELSSLIQRYVNFCVQSGISAEGATKLFSDLCLNFPTSLQQLKILSHPPSQHSSVPPVMGQPTHQALSTHPAMPHPTHQVPSTYPHPTFSAPRVSSGIGFWNGPQGSRLPSLPSSSSSSSSPSSASSSTAPPQISTPLWGNLNIFPSPDVTRTDQDKAEIDQDLSLGSELS